MPHFVTKPNHKSLKYYIFSTAVMGAITEKMYRKDMIEWLKTHENYEGFLDPRPLVEQIPDYYASMSSRIARKDTEYSYWNGDFWYVTEEDGWFV